MSRTDAHRPWQVQEADPLVQDFYWYWSGSSYGWTKMPLRRTCGCRMPGCSMYHFRRAQNRHRRHVDKLAAREVLKGNHDVFDERRKYWHDYY
jgi:hypothetical protein